PSFFIVVDNSITSTGHDGQSCFQHTMMSHPSMLWSCSVKWPLSYSNSIRTLCQRSPFLSILLLASQSGNGVPTASTVKPRSLATRANKYTTPCSFSGPCLKPLNSIGVPYSSLASLALLGLTLTFSVSGYSI